MKCYRSVKSPCYQCEERRYKCHVNCEPYKAFQRERETILEERKKYHMKTSLLFNSRYFY